MTTDDHGTLYFCHDNSDGTIAFYYLHNNSFCVNDLNGEIDFDDLKIIVGMIDKYLDAAKPISPSCEGKINTVTCCKSKTKIVFPPHAD